MTTNLLTRDDLETIPFDRMNARSVAARANVAIHKAKQLVEQIKTVPAGKRSQATVLEPLNRAYTVLRNAGGLCELVKSVFTDERARTAAEAADERVSAQNTAMSLDVELYRAVSGVDSTTLDWDYLRFYEDEMRNFRRNGVDRSASVRRRVQELKDEITVVGNEFERNCRDATGSIYIAPERLAGLPDSYIEAHPPNADGLVEIKAHAYPDLFPFYRFAEDDEARRELFVVRTTLAPENSTVLERLRALRHELATLLGYENYADYETEIQMMGSAANAADFIDALDDATADRNAADYAQLLAFKQTMEPGATEVFPWEDAYLSEQLKRSRYAFDSTTVMPYFRYRNVRDGIFATIERAFDVRIEEDSLAPGWHESVTAYLLYDGDGSLRGRFFLDMHPRDGKHTHAMCLSAVRGVSGEQMPQAVLVCNFTAETPDVPALMGYNEAVGFLHEFGHLVHVLLAGRGRIAKQSGTLGQKDFTEAPSNMLEFFFQSLVTLQMFAKHYETNEPIPAELVARMLAADAFGRGMGARRQAGFAWFSLNAYTRPDVPLEQLDREETARFGNFAPVDGTYWYTMFGHLYEYSARYYTYEISRTIATDFWSQFDPEDPFAGDVTMRYRREILEPGGSKDAADLCKGFLGRPFSHKAYRKWLNVTPEDVTANS